MESWTPEAKVALTLWTAEPAFTTSTAIGEPSSMPTTSSAARAIALGAALGSGTRYSPTAAASDTSTTSSSGMVQDGTTSGVAGGVATPAPGLPPVDPALPLLPPALPVDPAPADPAPVEVVPVTDVGGDDSTGGEVTVPPFPSCLERE